MTKHKIETRFWFYLFICLFFVLDEVIPMLLNSFFLQTFFYFCLQIKNYLYSVHLITALIFAFGIPFQVFMLASYSLDPYFWYGLILLLFNLYFRWKWIFLNPEFEGSIYKTLDNATPEVEKNFA